MQNKIGKIKLIDREFEKFIHWVLRAEEIFPDLLKWEHIIEIYKSLSFRSREILFTSLRKAIVDFR